MACPTGSHDNTASEQEQESAFTEIGRGTFGIIFTDASSLDNNRILKRTLVPNVDPHNWLENDAYWHERIYHTFAFASHSQASNLNLNLPNVSEYHGVHGVRSEWWSFWGRVPWRFMDSEQASSMYAETSPVLSAQRIPPVNYATRSALLRAFFPDMPAEVRRATLESGWNGASLLRVYFGESESNSNHTSQTRTRVRCGGEEGDEGEEVLIPNLRNFPLNRTRLKEALRSTDYEDVIKSMAGAMAALHWDVGCDGRDCEFVFGGVQPTISTDHDVSVGASVSVSADYSTREGERKGRTFKLFGQHEVEMWLLDFNQVTSITCDEAGIHKAVLGLLENDPYPPKPGWDGDSKDWEVFRGEYLGVSRAILERDLAAAEGEGVAVLKLPGMVMTGVERRHGLNDYQRLFGSDGSTGEWGPISFLEQLLGYLYWVVGA